MLFRGAGQLTGVLERAVEIHGNRVEVLDADRLRTHTVEPLLYNSLFHPSERARDVCRWILREAAAAEGIHCTSLAGLYAALARGLAPPVTVPLLRACVLPYDVARAVLRAARDHASEALAFAFGPEDASDTGLSVLDYASCVLAAALRERHGGPIFLRFGPLRVRSAAFALDAGAELSRLETLASDAVEAGFLNVHVDGSRLVDPGASTPLDKVALAAAVSGRLGAHVRGVRPRGGDVCLVSGIGDPGGREAVVDAARAFLDAFEVALHTRAGRVPGLSALSLRHSTEGPYELPVDPDLDLLREAGEVVSHDYRIGGTSIGDVTPLEQGRLSTLPPARVREAELSLALQDAVLDHPAFPLHIRDELHRRVDTQLRAERRPGEDAGDFRRRNRRRLLAPFLRELFDLDAAARDAIAGDLRTRAGGWIAQLGGTNTQGVIRDTIEIHAFETAIPVSGLARDAETALSDVLQHLSVP